MNFIKEIEAHLETFETKAKGEILSFIAHVKSKYSEPMAAVVPPAAPLAPNGELTIGQVEAPEVEEPAPVVETPVLEVTPVAEEPAAIESTPAEPTEEK